MMKKKILKIIGVFALTVVLISSFALSTFAEMGFTDVDADGTELGNTAPIYMKYPIYDFKVLTKKGSDYDAYMPNFPNWYNNTDCSYDYADFTFTKEGYWISSRNSQYEAIGFSLTYKDLVIRLSKWELENGYDLRSRWSSLPYVKYWGLGQSINYSLYNEETILKVDASYSIYTAEGEKRLTVESTSFPASVHELALRTNSNDGDSCKLSPFNPILQEVDSPDEIIVINYLRVYTPAEYSYLPSASDSFGDYGFCWPRVSEISKISGVHQAADILGFTSDPELLAKIEEKEKEIERLQKENFTLQNSNVIDEVFTGVSSSIWDGLETFAGIGYSFTDSGGIVRTVTVGNLIVIAVVGVVAVFVIKLIRGGG